MTNLGQKVNQRQSWEHPRLCVPCLPFNDFCSLCLPWLSSGKLNTHPSKVHASKKLKALHLSLSLLHMYRKVYILDILLGHIQSQ